MTDDTFRSLQVRQAEEAEARARLWNMAAWAVFWAPVLVALAIFVG